MCYFPTDDLYFSDLTDGINSGSVILPSESLSPRRGAARRVLRLGMAERPPILRVAANILNYQSRTADKG